MFSFIPLEDAKVALAKKKVAATAVTPISHQDERFDLFIYIPREHFALVAPQITALLVEATESLVITAFKVMDHDRLDECRGGGWPRDNNVPYTLYLHREYNPDEKSAGLATAFKNAL